MKITLPEIDIYITRIAAEDGATRSERERMAVAELVAEAFGSEAVKCNDALGAPYILLMNEERIGGCVSVSHSRHYAALAVSKLRYVGIDVEEDRAQLERVLPRITSAQEACYNTDARSRLEGWTLKEALYKAARGMAGRELDFSRDLRLPVGGCGASAAGIPFDHFCRMIDGHTMLSAVWEASPR